MHTTINDLMIYHNNIIHLQHKMPDGKNSLLPANMKRPATGRRTSLTSDPSRGMFVFDNM